MSRSDHDQKLSPEEDVDHDLLDYPAPRNRWFLYVLPVIALLVMTVRFPPADLSGLIASALGMTPRAVIGLCSIVCLGGALAARNHRDDQAFLLNAVIGAVAFLAMVTATITHLG